MDLEEKVRLITRAPTEEVVTEDDLRRLLESNEHPKHYIGLEISGFLHLGSLIITGLKINDFMKAGVKCKVFLADWHSYINEKFGGDWQKIRLAAKYYEEAFKFFCQGVDILLGSNLYQEYEPYWEEFVKFTRRITLARTTRCLTILGRSGREKLHFAQYLYPPMQAVDIRAMDLDLVHSGVDQRKVHMLVREVFPELGWKVPVAVHHSLLPGLSEPIRTGLDEDIKTDERISSKMSKSKPWTCIFIHDSANEVEARLRQAWCPEGQVVDNPVLEIARTIIFHEKDSLEVERSAKFGGSIVYEDYPDLEKAFREKKLHPADLKAAVAKEVNQLLSPIRSHFEGRRDLLDVFREEA